MRVAILLLLLAFASIAYADDREDRETARREFAAGQAADKRKAYQEAIEHYLRANELVPHPFAMFNIAVDYERLGKLRESAAWYEKYLDSSSMKDSDREKVNRILIDLRNKPALVNVVSNPDGARVIINGIPVGTTPYKNEIKGGLHHITVQKGQERDSKEITIEYGEPVTVQFAFSGAATTTTSVTPMQPTQPEIRRPPAPRGASGVLAVTGEPYGALVAVDNVPIGTLPTQIPLEPGTHSVRVTANGYSPYEQQVTISASGRTPINVQLSRALGTLTPATGGGEGLKVGYLLGGGGGADAKGAGSIYIGEVGVRASSYDLSGRLGKAGDFTLIDLIARWTMTKTRLAPFIGGGYTFVSGGYGYAFFGGLRFDVSDGDKAGISIMAEGGYRFFTGTPTSDDGTTPETTEGSIVPIMAYVLIRYR